MKAAFFLLSLLLMACGEDANTGVDATSDTTSGNARVEEGLIAYYPMTAGVGAQLRDTSGAGSPLILQMLGTGAGVTEWLSERNGIVVQSENKILVSAARKLGDAIIPGSAFTLELWCAPSNLTAAGAWIAGYSQAETDRNLTLVQDGAGLAVWLRTSATDSSGLIGGQPPLAVSDVLVQGENHIVVTFDSGALRLYVGGALAGSAEPGGDLSTWVSGHTLILANEVTGNHPWTGEYYQLAWYDRALSADEVATQFAAGSRITP